MWVLTGWTILPKNIWDESLSLHAWKGKGFLHFCLVRLHGIKVLWLRMAEGKIEMKARMMVTSWWEWVLVYGCCFLPSLPLFSQPITQSPEKGHGTGKPPEPAFLYGLWKIPRSPHACPQSCNNFHWREWWKHKAESLSSSCPWAACGCWPALCQERFWARTRPWKGSEQ